MSAASPSPARRREDRPAPTGARWWARLATTRAAGPLLLLGAGLGYLGLAQFSVWLNDPINLGAAFWPAAGLTLGLLALLPPRWWGWVVAGAALAELGGDLARGYDLVATLWWTAGNAVEPVVGATLLRRWGNPGGLLVPVRQLRTFFLAAVLAGPLVGASLGAVGIASLGNSSYAQAWPSYLIGDALGVLVVAPLLLCWREPRIVRASAETVAVVAAVVVVPVLAFRAVGDAWEPALPYLVVPAMTWAALRYGCRGAALAVFVVTQIANWSTATGDGPFVLVGDSSVDAVTLVQVFLVTTSVTTFVLAALVEDLVDRGEVETRLARQASTDSLTGLPNRVVLTATLGERLRSTSSGVGVCACDVDHFKVVNDGLGHHAGDEVLVELARRMRASVRPADLVARFGGDEFVIVAEGTGDDLEALARRLMLTVAAPMSLSDGSTLTPSISVGVAHTTAGHDPASLLRDADAALFRAKELGRGRFHRFDEQLRLRVVDRLFLQTEWAGALRGGQVTSAFQPEVVLATGQLFSFEALARWQHPTAGAIPPDRFVPVVEAMGAAEQLFDHMVDQALRAQADWASRLGFHPAVAVNLSARQLGDRDLPALVARALERHHAPADGLWLEVTESALAEETATDTLLALHDVGVKLAIDDFGTGWSSMARLAAFPWDLLKIDKSFVEALDGPNAHAEQVVRSTIAIAHALGILTTAEGVETPEQLERLGELGCDVVQGYLLSRPVPPLDALEHVGADGRWSGPGAPRARRATDLPTSVRRW